LGDDFDENTTTTFTFNVSRGIIIAASSTPDTGLPDYDTTVSSSTENDTQGSYF
jgi:hypothetical protein